MGEQREIDNELVELAAEAGARAAIKLMKDAETHEKKSRHSQRLRNTKLLLRNYRTLKAHADNAVFEIGETIEENALDILDLMWDTGGKSKVFVESIRNSVERTIIIMRHVTEMVELYGDICAVSSRLEDQRRYRVVCGMYIDEKPQTAKQLAEVEKIDTRTVYKDIDIAAERLSALIFGIDGIKRD